MNFPTRVKESGALVVNLSNYNCIYNFAKPTQSIVGRCYLILTKICEVSNPESSRYRYSIKIDGIDSLESHYGYGNRLTLSKENNNICIRLDGDMPLECLLKDRLCSGLLMRRAQ